MSRPTTQCDHPLDILFHPRSVAVVGVSGNPDNAGHTFLRQLLEFPFKGTLHAVGVEDREIMGLPCHARLTDIQGPVDHVISCIPHHQVSALVEDCVAKGVRSLHLFTARLAETQLAERVELERRLVRRAREGNVRIIGPNCMGLYCPSEGLTFRDSLPKEPGHIAFASQSGGNAADLEYQGAGRGLRFSKIISFGNASDLNESDFFEYLLADPDTWVIAMYLEGVRQGARFLDLLRRSRGRKPVVLFKAGRTGAGSRAVLSHTASLSGQEELWESVCRQFGIIRVHSMEEMADALLAFQFLKPFTGRRVLVMGGGGGGSVAAADVCETEGFEVPPLPPEMRDRIKSFAPQVWALISNPMDGSVMGGMETMMRAYELGASWDGVDALIGNSSAVWLLDSESGAKRHAMSLELLIHLAKKFQKPTVLFVNSGDPTTRWRVEAVLQALDRCREAGIPVYPNIQRAAKALAHFATYHERFTRT